MLRISLFGISFFFLFSCFPRKKIVHGFTSEYYYLSTDRKRIKFDSTPYVQIKKEGFYHAVNGKTLKKELIKHPKSLLYLWDPRCGSEFCYSLPWIESYANQNEIKLFIIPIFIDVEVFDFVDEDIESLITPMDFKYYKSIFCHKYISYFLYDLGLENSAILEKNDGRYYWFEKDSLVKKTQGIEP